MSLFCIDHLLLGTGPGRNSGTSYETHRKLTFHLWVGINYRQLLGQGGGSVHFFQDLIQTNPARALCMLPLPLWVRMWISPAVLKVLFPWCPPSPWALTLFFASSSAVSWALREEMDGDIPFRTRYSKSLILCILSSCESLSLSSVGGRFSGGGFDDTDL